jgi:signal transduction histidine kinase
MAKGSLSGPPGVLRGAHRRAVVLSRPRREGVTGGWWTALLAEVKEPLARALETVARHGPQVHSDWRRTLAGFTFNPDELHALSVLKPEAHEQDLRAGNFEGYIRSLEHEGQALASRGVHEEHARAALFCYLESSLPYVVREGKNPGQLAAALVRLASIGALSLSSGYANARAASWRSFGERERRRLSRDLHDEIGHHLVVLKLYLGMIAKELTTRPPAQTRRKLDEATGLVSQGIQSVRRLILDLGPGALEELGLLPALRLYARQFTSRTGVKVRVLASGTPWKLPSSHETALYRVLQGALSNVLNHARARNVVVTMGRAKQGAITMVIEDDGVGFDTAVRQQAFGLAAMRERITSLGGGFRVESRRAAAGRRRHGTRIEVELPVVPESP